MKVLLELFISCIQENEILYKRASLNISENNTDPDNTVFKWLQREIPNLDEEKMILHSTSWHFEKPEQIYLSYLVHLPHEYLKKDKGLKACSIYHTKKEGTAIKPRPEGLTETDIIQHAYRHLAFLIHHEKSTKYTERLSKDEVKKLKNLHEDPAGEL